MIIEWLQFCIKCTKISKCKRIIELTEIFQLIVIGPLLKE